MRIVRSAIAGAFLIEQEAAVDGRGWFARLFDGEEFRRHGLATRFDQTSLAHNLARGTLRGLHYQASPHGEAKLVTCVRGRGFDVVVDARPESPTYLRWLGEELSADGARSVYVPEGVAHGFLALEDATTVLYQIAGRYEPGSARGLRWNDPRLAIDWPEQPRTLAVRDEQWALLD